MNVIKESLSIFLYGILSSAVLYLLYFLLSYLYTYLSIQYRLKIKKVKHVCAYILVGDMTSDLRDITLEDNVNKIKDYLSNHYKSFFKSKISFERVYDYRDKENDHDDKFFFGVRFDSYGNPYNHEYCPSNYPTYYFLRVGFLLVRDEHLYDYDSWKAKMSYLLKDTVVEYVDKGDKYFDSMCKDIWNHKYQNFVTIKRYQRDKMAKRILDKRLTISQLASKMKSIC